jgi:small subunit ribosomal protein S5
MAVQQQPKEFEETVISIDRVARVVKGGRRFRFRATVVIGDGKGRVGLGVGKGGEVVTSIAKAVARARRNLITIPMAGNTIPHEITVKFSGAHIMLKPASPGTGVIAGGAVRSVVEVAGIHDLLTKSFGSTNKLNNAYATIMALSQVKPIDESPLANQRLGAKRVAAKAAKKAEKTEEAVA